MNKIARFVKVFCSTRNEIIEGFVIAKNVYNDNVIDYKIITSDLSKKWVSCDNVPYDINEDVMVKIPNWFIKLANLKGYEKFEFRNS